MLVVPSGHVELLVVSVPLHANVTVVHAVQLAADAPPVLYVFALQFPVIPWALLALNPYVPLLLQYLPAGQLLHALAFAAR